MFKTVQQCLLESDTKEVLAAYHEALPINYEMIENKDLTLRGIQERSDKRITEFIEYMRTIPLATEKTPAVFFAVPEISEDHDYIDTGVAMCEMEDLKEEGEPQTYSWLLMSHAEVAACLVADTAMTKEFLPDVLGIILAETSFFGFEQSDIDKVRKDLEEADKELKTGNGHTCTDICELFGNHRLPSDFVDEEADKLLNERIRIETEFNRVCRNAEVANVRELLEDDNLLFAITPADVGEITDAHIEEVKRIAREIKKRKKNGGENG